VSWAGPPSADEIRVRDRERLMQDPIFAEEATEEDLAMARALLAERSAEEIANALVRFNRSRLPAPEEIVDAGSDREPRQRKDKRERSEERSRGFNDRDRGSSEGGFERSSEDMVWFRMSVGRRNNADPRWLLPIICRLGHVTKKEIGSIKIFDRETKFEIVKSQASKFASAVRKTNDEDIQIELADAGPGKPAFGKAGPGKPRDAKPWSGPKGNGPKSHGPKSYGSKERGDHPARKGPPDGKGPKEFKGPKDFKKSKDKKRPSDKRP
jgi:ATP-dependent RNA helicase DeaD